MGTAEGWRRVDWERALGEVRVGGRRLAYVDHGDGPPVLLVHGMAGSWESWLANIDALAERHRVLAVDLPGFGDSEPLADGEDFDGYVRSLRDLMDELGVPSVAVVGHSLGGLVALSLASQVPERVRCVVLVSGGGAVLSRPRLLAIQVAFWFLAAILRIPGSYRVLTSTRVVRAATWPAIHAGRDVPIDLLRRMMPRRVGPGFMHAVRRASEQLGRLDLRRITAPVLLVWGRHDRILPLTAGEQLDHALLQSRLVVVERAGHCAMFEAPDAFHALVTNFLGMQLEDRNGSPTGRASARSWSAPRVESRANDRYGDGNAG